MRPTHVQKKARAFSLALTPGDHSTARDIGYLFIEIWTVHNRQYL